MREDAVEVTLEPAHVGMILMRPYPGEERGLLLLNVAETEARIRFLFGFMWVSFFVDRQSGIVAEYLRWRSAEDVGNASGSRHSSSTCPCSKRCWNTRPSSSGRPPQ